MSGSAPPTEQVGIGKSVPIRCPATRLTHAVVLPTLGQDSTTEQTVIAALKQQLADQQALLEKQAAELKRIQQHQQSDSSGTTAQKVARGKSSMISRVLNDSVVEGFKAEFRDPHGTLDALCKYADKIVAAWKDGRDYIAPTGTILQASSTGKSRLVVQVGRERFLFFVCLRDKSELHIRLVAASQTQSLATQQIHVMGVGILCRLH
ncbi:hypothetical protein BC831DRAFT_55847 [Entophlyctis helioformis]|nr:hypothetical protein BC831DRAFT_55847 [Entophlyctis helioformis]